MSADRMSLRRRLSAYWDAFCGVVCVFMGVGGFWAGVWNDDNAWWAPPLLLFGGLYMLFRVLRQSEGWFRRRS